jgi:hypothetical protein
MNLLAKDYTSLIRNIKQKMLQIPYALGEDPFPVKHMFAEKLYIREIIIPKGYLILGKKHKQSYFNCLLQGKIEILTEEGVKTFVAPAYVVSPAGTQRFALAYEDSVWLTVHENPNNLTNLDELDDLIHEKEEVFPDEENKPFNIKRFRELTNKLFVEKFGLWDKWSDELKDVFLNSKESDNEEILEWIKLRDEGIERGCNPLFLVGRLVCEQIKLT